VTRRTDTELCDLLALTNQPREAVRVARDWLLECFTDEGCAESIGLLNAVGVVQGIESHYDGGFRSSSPITCSARIAGARQRRPVARGVLRVAGPACRDAGPARGVVARGVFLVGSRVMGADRIARATRYAGIAAALLEQADAARRMSESPTIHQREDFAREAASLESLAGHNLGYGFAAALEINYYHGRADVDYFGAREALDDSRGDHPHGDAPREVADV
jgi:hypothetical protein